MSIIADVTTSAESFTLSQTLIAIPDMTVRTAGNPQQRVSSSVWAPGGDFETFQEARQEDPTVVTATVIEEDDDNVLY